MGVSIRTGSSAVNTAGDAGNVAWSQFGGSSLADAVSSANIDTSYAGCATDIAGGTNSGASQKLDVTNFFTSAQIPAGSTNIFLRARLSRRRTTGSAGRTIKDNNVRLLVAGAEAGVSLADAPTDWPTSFADRWYGSSTADDWSAAVTQAQAVASNFGIRIRVLGNADSDLGHTLPEARVSMVELEATFTDPVGVRRRAVSLAWL